MNKYVCIGNFTADPDVRYTQDGKAVAKFTLGVARKKKDAGADFPRFVAFDKPAEFVGKYFKKGMKAAVEGHLQTGSYEDKDGKKVYTTDIIVESIEFVEKKSEESKPVDSGNNFMSIPDGDFDNLPFD